LCELSPDFASYPSDKRICILKISMEYKCKNIDRRKTKVHGAKRVLASFISPQISPRILVEIELGPPHKTQSS